MPLGNRSCGTVIDRLDTNKPDPRIQSAIESGQRNAAGFVLVKNWCAHVRIERFGGVGLVEQATGLPIGHHGLACDYAPAGGMSCFDIRDAALHFYDQNCRNCAQRKPVGIPNISSWISERDAAIEKRRALEDAETREVAEQLAARRAARIALRSGLSPTSADIIDQIEELDIQRKPEFSARLVTTVKLAPETFSSSIIEYAFSLLEGREYWFDEAGLEILAALKAEPKRLVRCAMGCLQRWSATRTATSILLRHLSVADEALIPAMLPTLITMAAPSHEIFSDHKPPKIAALIRVNSAFPKEVKASLEALLDAQPFEIGLAARALTVLARRDRPLIAHCTRTLISKFVRSTWMPDSESFGHDVPQNTAVYLKDAIVTAFLFDPEATDALLQSFRLGASDSGEARIFSIYSRVLHAGRFRRIREVGAADRLAFKRLLWEAPKTSSSSVIREIHQAINGDPYDLASLARDEVDSLLGAAVLMDTRITAFRADKTPPKDGFLDALERENWLMSLTHLRDSFIKWAAHGAALAGNHASYLKVFEGLPDDQESLAACMVENSVALMDSAFGLNAVLPSLYSSLVGASVLRRGAGALAVGEMPWQQRDNAPSLLFEAFVTTLSDPYIYVHRSAVTALDRIRLPASFDQALRDALFNILLGHAKNPDQADLVLKCISLLSRRYFTAEQKTGKIGAYLVAQLGKMPAWRLTQDIISLARNLAHAEGIVDLLVAQLGNWEVMSHGQDQVLSALEELPDEIIKANCQKLATIKLNENRNRLWLLGLMQLLSRAYCWTEAEKLATHVLASIPDTIREKTVRTLFQLAQAAAAFECALERGDHDSAVATAERWREINTIREVDERERSRNPDFP